MAEHSTVTIPLHRARAARHLLIGSLVVAAAACGGRAPPPSQLTYLSSVPAIGPVVMAPAQYEGMPAASRPHVEGRHLDATQIVSSPEFLSVLLDAEVVYGQPDRDLMSGRQLAARYFGAYAPTEIRYPICYGFKSGGGRTTASTGLYYEKCGNGDALSALVTLRTITVERAASPVLEAKACAVNTLTHEWAHALGTQRGAIIDSALVDTGAGAPRGPLASYVIGSIAQCVYLQRERKSPGFDIKGCIVAAGTHTFDPDSCEPQWSDQFDRR